MFQLSTLLTSLPGAVSQGLIYGVMALGVFITYRILDIADLTVDGSFATGAAVSVMCIRAGVPPMLSLLIAIAAGMLAGMATGIFHTMMGIPAILAGILTQFSLYSINLHIMGKANQAVNFRYYNLVVTQSKAGAVGLDNPIVTMAVISLLLVCLLYVFFNTEYGCGMQAGGANEKMARSQGINTNLLKVVGLMLSNGLVALSGGLMAQFSGTADVNLGRGAIVIGLAAVIIGEVVLGKLLKSFWARLFSAVIGAVIYYIVITLVLQMGLNSDDLKMLTALVVAVFLAVPFWKSKAASAGLNRKSNKEVRNNA